MKAKRNGLKLPIPSITGSLSEMGTFSRDERIMRRVLGLASKGQGRVSPNPLVGCMIFKDGIKIGEGFHQKFGGPHAEVNAIGSVVNPSDLKGAELYVNLEPCCHFGKTPPCTDLIIQSGIRRVIICNEDPFEKVAGNGIRQLKEAGIEVSLHIRKEEGLDLNRPFFYSQTRKMPFVTVKIAQTADGRVSTGTGASKWITNEQSRADVHRLRSLTDGILTGSGTVKADNPRLTIRTGSSEKQPYRLILDTRLSIPAHSWVLTDEFAEKTLVFHSDDLSGPCGSKSRFIPVPVKGNHLDLEQVLKTCFKLGIHQILAEAGPGLTSNLIREALVNRLVIYQAGNFLGDGPAAFNRHQILSSVSEGNPLKLESVDRFGNDIRLTYLVKE